MTKIIYMDNAATTKVDDKVFEAMLPYLKEEYGNPSSIYSLGRDAKVEIEKTRNLVSSFFNAKASEIYFTSGGTEANNWALFGTMRANKKKGKHLITTSIEHPSVLEPIRKLSEEGFEVTFLDVDRNGFVDLKELKNSIRKDTVMVSIGFANSEIGTVQKVKEIGEICQEHDIIFHTDAVQAIGELTIDVNNLGIDLLSLSGHKIFGPKFVGALFVRNGVKVENIICGGSQEKGKRPGTENVAYIVGLGKAIELAHQNMKEYVAYTEKLRDVFKEELFKRLEGCVLNGPEKERLAGNLNITFPAINGNLFLTQLDMKGICASMGSACSAGSLEPSHVLKAIGLEDDIAFNSLRFSLSKNNTVEEVYKVVDEIEKIVTKFRNA